MVALSHLWNDLIWWQGIYGVFGFYVISGYLMTLILSEVYTGFANSWRYALNRILRIFPVYWAALAIALIVGYLGLETLIKDIEAAYQPQSATEFIGNFTLVAFWESKLTISQAWSLRVELVYYALMVFLCRDWRIVLIWLFCSILICAYQVNENSVFYLRYSTIAGASIAFALGGFGLSFEKPPAFVANPLVYFDHSFLWPLGIRKSHMELPSRSPWICNAFCAASFRAVWQYISGSLSHLGDRQRV